MSPSNNHLDRTGGVADGEDGEKLEGLLGGEKVVPYIESKTLRASAPQVLATWAQSWLLLTLGMMLNVPTLVVGSLHHNQEEGELNLSDAQASWFAGILLILEPIGALFSGTLQDVLGRKKSMILVNVPQFAGWLLLHWATTPFDLFLAAFCLGFSIGFMEAPVLSYVGEICQPRLRGTLASFTSLHVTLGLLLMFLLGHITAWRTAALISAIFPVITVIAILSVPESPVWLMMKGRKEDSLKALCWLRGWVQPEIVMPEYKALERHIQVSRSQASTEKRSLWEKAVASARDVFRPEMLGPFKLVLTYFFFAHCGGLSATRPYVVRISKKLGILMDPYLVTVVGGVLHVVGCLTCMLLMRRLGKRSLSLISMTACVIVGLGLATYSLLQEVAGVDIPWIPLVLLLSVFLFTSLGIFIIPWALVSEVFPTRGRGIGGGLTSAIYYFMFFAATKTFLDLEHLLRLWGVLYIYGIIGFIGIFFIYYKLPETEGMKLEDVERYFKSKIDKKVPV